MKKIKIGILGAGTMGAGIAHVLARAGHEIVLVDKNEQAIEKAKITHIKLADKLLQKQTISLQEKENISKKYQYSNKLDDFSNCELIIEAIVENLTIKRQVFKEIETIVSDKCIIASNTSSLSITSIASTLHIPDRVIGIHFFNPAYIMTLVEIIPALQSDLQTISFVRKLVESWGKHGVVCKDTPGFLVNRIARPFYGEALRIYEERIADFATIDWAMTEIAGFKMGPFTLMDYIGNDVNYAVTESVFEAFYFDPKYKPSLTQKRYVEATFLGRKTNRGYYNYEENAVKINPTTDMHLGQQIVDRILAMLFNEAIDAFYLQIASQEDIETAMTKGVNYPQGLIAWAEKRTLKHTHKVLTNLYQDYREDRYRPSFLLQQLVKHNKTKVELITW